MCKDFASTLVLLIHLAVSLESDAAERCLESFANVRECHVGQGPVLESCRTLVP